MNASKESQEGGSKLLDKNTFSLSLHNVPEYIKWEINSGPQLVADNKGIKRRSYLECVIPAMGLVAVSTKARFFASG